MWYETQMLRCQLLLLMMMRMGVAGVDSDYRDEFEDSPEKDCHVPLGVADPGVLPPYLLYSPEGPTDRGRLDRTAAWVTDLPLMYSRRRQGQGSRVFRYAWLQVDLHRPMLVTGLQTQGDPESDSWVTWYTVLHSNDCERFQPMHDADGNAATYHGNFDSNTTVTNFFHHVAVTRCVRIVPLLRHGNTSALRIEILGCDVRLCHEAIVPHLMQDADPEVFTSPRVTNSTTLEDLLPQEDDHVYQESFATPPTRVTREYGEFKFPAEQVILGVVFYRPQNVPLTEGSFIVMYSRNCHDWEAIRERKGYGDPLEFREHRRNRLYFWHSFNYPVRAQCVRLVTDSHRYVARESTILAQFVGCGTGHGAIEQCGMQKLVRSPRVKRIVDGSTSRHPGLWPWLVSLRIQKKKKWRHLCGATVINRQYLLTAAHCIAVMSSQLRGFFTGNDTAINDPDFRSLLRARVGEHSLKIEEGHSTDVTIGRIILHPDYNSTTYANDLAILRLDQPLSFTDHVSVVCLPDVTEVFANSTACRAVGWGRTQSGYPHRPHYADMQLVPTAACQRAYAPIQLSADMICASKHVPGPDVCLGDSGGPLVCEFAGRWHQVGVVSWNVGCDDYLHPGVYARVPYMLDWIKQVIGEPVADSGEG